MKMTIKFCETAIEETENEKKEVNLKLQLNKYQRTSKQKPRINNPTT